MVIKMKISWIKYEKDYRSFKLPETLGFDVFRLQDLEQTDGLIKKLVQQNYDTIVISNEVASYSSDIIKKYPKNKKVKIVISLDNE